MNAIQRAWRRLVGTPPASLEVYVDGVRRPDLDNSAGPDIAAARVMMTTGRAAIANCEGNRVDIKVCGE